jgi:2-polyprenyl-3-methyl-5-hydroxy-6-metoxy-1,4-benzoquinol methylase
MKNDTTDAGYTRYLLASQDIWWKRILDIQRPYRMHLQALKLGKTIDIGCGVGRNLRNLVKGSVGIDHNASSVEACRSLGLVAYEPDAFFAEAQGQTFDAILLAHVAEHMTLANAVVLLQPYMPLLRSGGRLVLLTPQEKGFASDTTHVEFMDHSAHQRLCSELGLRVTKAYSFPFPRAVGKVFPYNEFVSVAVKA